MYSEINVTVELPIISLILINLLHNLTTSIILSISQLTECLPCLYYHCYLFRRDCCLLPVRSLVEDPFHLTSCLHSSTFTISLNLPFMMPKVLEPTGLGGDLFVSKAVWLLVHYYLTVHVPVRNEKSFAIIFQQLIYLHT